MSTGLLSLTLAVALVFKFVPTPAGQKDCRSVTSINEYTLSGHAYKSILGKQLMTCVVTCDLDPKCYSLNYRFPTMTCELSGETRVSHPRDFRYTADSVYLEHLSRPAGSCFNGWPCRNRATCVNVPMNPGYKCYCQDGYVGELCEECSSPPLGLSDNRIPDSEIVGSSYGQWYTTYFMPYMGRLNGKLSWVAKIFDSQPWLQVNLTPKTRLVTHIATQGCPTQNWWTEKFTVDYKLGGQEWTQYKENGIHKEFVGNNDSNAVVKHSFKPPFQALYVRVYPTDVYKRTAMRIEFYGCTVF